MNGMNFDVSSWWNYLRPEEYLWNGIILVLKIIWKGNLAVILLRAQAIFIILNLCLFFIRSFLESDKIKAVISIGCCYNLLSEQATEEASFPCGFPMSEGVKSAGFPLGKSARDLACQVCKWTLVLKVHNFSAVKYIVKFVYSPT